MKRYSENVFESAIIEHLTDASQQFPYRLGSMELYNRETALNTSELIEFLRTTQPQEWERITNIHKQHTETNLVNRLLKDLELRGSLDVLRKGFTDYGVHFKLAYFKPETSFNPDLQSQYEKNILTITRQVKYSLKNENALDLVLFLNGIPVATVELKNQLSGQSVINARSQFRFDRDPKELLFSFKKRALVHFIADTDEVYITTKLAGANTYFLPFNKGNQGGAGNPVNRDGYRTEYLWKDIWEKDKWLDIIGRFIHLEVKEEEVGAKTIRKEAMIFPRYHQLSAVREILKNVKQNGPGRSYLVQHSAGSGKSNTIAWLSYRLANLHNERDERIFDSVVVVTDRKVLDSQLQNTIFQFEHKQGVVQKIDENSQQLADAITKGTNIIITTLQKFPFILDKVQDVSNRKYAIIIDEAHSSQGGEASRKMKEVLSAKQGANDEEILTMAAEEDITENDEEDYEDEIRRTVESHGRQPNISFFAFTATPKYKTLKVFSGSNNEGKPVPFHLYSMRQAIEENFIMDVLKGYTTYKLYFRLNKEITDDPKVPKAKAANAVARFVSLHPHNLAQKTEIIIEHFRRVTMKKIGGKAKAMVVTGSRLHALRYKQEFDQYIKEKGYTDLRTLVAFSGTVRYSGLTYTEVQINGFGEKELPRKFNTHDYGILIVAEKYQTGFDQPLLHTMYVDKKLSGLKAVQTLSRLNRVCPGKEDTFILDFANEKEEIQAAFQPYYEITTSEVDVDPNHVYDLKNQIEASQVIWMNEVEEFVKWIYKPNFTPRDQEKLNAFLDPAVERFKALPATKDESLSAPANKEDFKHLLTVFIRFYNFMTQVINYKDIGLEKYHIYCRYLLRKLPPLNTADMFSLKGDELSLEYYRLQKTAENINIELEKKPGKLDGMTEAGLRGSKEEKALLSEIIKIVNDRFGTDFTDADRLLIEQIVEDCVNDETLTDQARSNTMDNFKFGFEDIYFQKWIERMEQNKELFTKVMDDVEFSNYLKSFIMKQVYNRLRGV